MEHQLDLEQYLSNGVENIIKGVIKASLRNPKESIFLAKYALDSKKSRALRKEYKEKGEHIPPFLIASITSSCNLHCKGCYARANHACHDSENSNQLTSKEWGTIFHQASDLGIGFVLLAGGEPMTRLDVLNEAAKHPSIVFPIFTNGTLLNDSYLTLLDKRRNLIPVLSIEGEKEKTDLRRGSGVYDKLLQTMDSLNQKGILYGASVTVTKENITEVTSEPFLTQLSGRGCKVVFFIEYVPVDNSTKDIAPGDKERKFLEEKLFTLRQSVNDLVFISFPGDEKTSGGCLAAGRGFFHINPNGAAEPCPFSPYSDCNLRQVSLLTALHSPLFQKLKSEEILMQEHIGGCVLFELEETVKSISDYS